MENWTTSFKTDIAIDDDQSDPIFLRRTGGWRYAPTSEDIVKFESAIPSFSETCFRGRTHPKTSRFRNYLFVNASPDYRICLVAKQPALLAPSAPCVTRGVRSRVSYCPIVLASLSRTAVKSPFRIPMRIRRANGYSNAASETTSDAKQPIPVFDDYSELFLGCPMRHLT